MPDSAPRSNADADFPFAWPAEGLTRIPDWVYWPSSEIYEREASSASFTGPPGISLHWRPSFRSPDASVAPSLGRRRSW